MITFEEVMKLTSGVSGNAAFEDEECHAYYDLAAALLPGSIIVEIGLQYGRSSSIVLQVTGDQGHRYTGIDPFESPEVQDAFVRMAGGIPMKATAVTSLVFHASTVAESMGYVPNQIDMALIDGDHSYAAVREDCRIILPRIKPGGHVCFHDYGRESLPEVYPAVQDAMKGQPFVEVLKAGTLGVWRHI